MIYEITVILDTLHRSKHLSVETCHPHVELCSNYNKGTPAGIPSQIPEDLVVLAAL